MYVHPEVHRVLESVVPSLHCDEKRTCLSQHEPQRPERVQCESSLSLRLSDCRLPYKTAIDNGDMIVGTRIASLRCKGGVATTNKRQFKLWPSCPPARDRHVLYIGESESRCSDNAEVIVSIMW